MKKLLYIAVIVLSFTSCQNKKAVVVNNPNNNTSIVVKYAEKLQVPQSTITNLKLYQFVDDWYGTKYKYGGLTKAGVDCSGFCNVLYSKVYNKTLPRSTKDIVKVINKVPQSKLKEGDLVFFNISGKKNSHVGVYLKNNYFVHASTSKGVIISSLTNPYYVKAYNKGGEV